MSGADRHGALDTAPPVRRRGRLALAGAVFGFAGLGAWLAWLGPSWLGLHGAAARLLGWLSMPLAFALGTALPPWLDRFRSPRPGRVVWTTEGIVEWDGDHVRTALSWDTATGRVESSGGVPVLAQVRDAEGRTITVARQGATPPWLVRRAASTVDLASLCAVLVDLPAGPTIAPDARDARRPTMGRLAWALPVLAFGGAVGLAGLLPGLRPFVPPFAALTLCMLFAVPALRPVHELLAWLEEERRFERAESVRVEGGEGSEALAQRADGGWVRLDVAKAAHPDAWLATRAHGELHVVLPHAGWVASPTRRSTGAVVPVEEVETAHERAVRRRHLAALVLELAVRGAAVVWWGAASFSPLAS